MSTPTEQITQNLKEVTVTDKRGRRITLKKYSYLRETQFIRMLGDAAQNDRYVNGVLPVLYVTSIDDDRVLTPNSQRELDAIISRLDEDGMIAVGQCIVENFMETVPIGTARLHGLIKEMDANLIADLIEYAEDLLSSYTKPAKETQSLGDQLKKSPETQS